MLPVLGGEARESAASLRVWTAEAWRRLDSQREEREEGFWRDEAKR